MRALRVPKKSYFLCCFPLLWIAISAFTGRPLPFVHYFTPATDIINVCGTSTTLTTHDIPAGYTNLIWDDGSTGSTRTVNAAGDYWWQVTGTSIVTNGAFTNGNTGFTSDYTYAANDPNPNVRNELWTEGYYGVYNNPYELHSGFGNFADHTNNSSGARNMLIVNGSPVAGMTVWKQTITVAPNTDYVFSAWVTSASLGNPAILQFSIGGTSLGTITPALAVGPPWQYFTQTWNSGSNSGPISISLVNQNTVLSGNDFAVDDIVFAPVYRQNVHVVFNPIPVLALNGPHTACAVYDLTQTITGYDPATYTYFFTDSLGNIVTNPAAITQSGVYTITEQNKTTGCTSLPQTTTITIQPLPQKPGITSL
ncbi:MAG: type sorting protein [Mucilaginibacter sp.]|nr:type sorting protein [Mucilaginibacter sp.]